VDSNPLSPYDFVVGRLLSTHASRRDDFVARTFEWQEGQESFRVLLNGQQMIATFISHFIIHHNHANPPNPKKAASLLTAQSRHEFPTPGTLFFTIDVRYIISSN